METSTLSRKCTKCSSLQFPNKKDEHKTNVTVKSKKASDAAGTRCAGYIKQMTERKSKPTQADYGRNRGEKREGKKEKKKG
jgi:hypothetical protein